MEEFNVIRKHYMTSIRNTLDMECYRAALLDIEKYCNNGKITEKDCLKAIKLVINTIAEVLHDER